MVNYVHFSYLSFLLEIDIRNYIIAVCKEIPLSLSQLQHTYRMGTPGTKGQAFQSFLRFAVS